MASTMVNPLQNIFNLLCLDPKEESLSMTAIDWQNVFVKNEHLKVEVTPWFMGCRMDVVLVGMKTLTSLSISFRALEWPGVLSISCTMLKGIFFFWAVGVNNGLKMFGKPYCKEICLYSGIVVLFIEHRLSRLSIILKDLRIFRMVNSGRWWGTGKPGMLQSIGLQRVRHNLVTDQQQQMSTGFNLKLIAMLPPSKRIRLSFKFEAGHWLLQLWKS